MRRILSKKSISLPVAVGVGVASGFAVGTSSSSLSLSFFSPFRNKLLQETYCEHQEDSSRNTKMSEENIPGLYAQDKLRAMSINIHGKENENGSFYLWQSFRK